MLTREQLEIKIEKLEQKLATDTLTRAKTRAYFLEYFHQYAENGAVLYFLDVDDFKSVNDYYGHIVGDELLARIVEKLSDTIKSSGFISRIGGDEFVIVIDALEADQIEHKALELLHSVTTATVKAKDLLISRNASIGCLKLNHKMTAHEAIDLADHAARDSKKYGKNRSTTFDPDRYYMLKRKPSLDELKRGLTNGEISYYVQPILQCSKTSIWAYEALLRWTRENGQVLTPKHFLHTMTGAYSGGSKPPLEAARKTAEWATLERGKYISFNISSEFLAHVEADNFSWVDQIIGQSPVEKIIFEITETTACTSVDGIAEVVHALRSRGIKVALDDFGIGSSNLLRLARVPVDFVKIDRVFLHNASKDPKNFKILSNTVDLCKDTGARIVIEGVEAPHDLKNAVEAGADFLQGFLLGSPMPTHEAF